MEIFAVFLIEQKISSLFSLDAQLRPLKYDMSSTSHNLSTFRKLPRDLEHNYRGCSRQLKYRIGKGFD